MKFLFQLTRPSRGATISLGCISSTAQFQLTRPSRGATANFNASFISNTFQLTRPSRGATMTTIKLNDEIFISTHTPLAGRDIGGIICIFMHTKFQLTRPSRGATVRYPVRQPSAGAFQLTRPSRGATRLLGAFLVDAEFQLTRPSRGATAIRINEKYASGYFNSHAPRGARRFPAWT